MQQKETKSILAYLELKSTLTEEQCAKKDKNKSCCDKIQRKGKFCKKCPLLNLV